MYNPQSFLLSILLMFITLWLRNQPQPIVAHSTKKENQDCVHQCGKIGIPYPFGIGASCSYSDSFIITCTYSSSSSSYVPVLSNLNLEVLNLTTAEVFDGWVGTVSVKSPSVTVCRGNSPKRETSGSSIVEAWWTSPNNITGPVFSISDDSIFVSVGCNGYAALYNETGGFVTGCSSICTPNPPLKGLKENLCEGYLCCQRDLSHVSFRSYTIGASINNGAGNCTSAYLVSKDYLEANYASLLASSMNFVPVELSFRVYKHGGPGLADFGLVMLSLGIPIFGTLLLTCAGFWLCWSCKTKRRRNEIKLKAKYFKTRLVEEQKVVDEEAVENTKLFTIKELKKATGNFSKDRVLGQGGQGTVYKGMLVSGQVLAVKRSKAFNDTPWKEFINEVILLSQIKHKHVVKLLGCCLETNQPLLVYEFVPNGTLSEHIHNSTKECSLLWETRLRIAAESATAISYLHSESSTPIYHRDIKSSNILLDQNFMAKVSDFGISKAVSVDQTHLTTIVKGTFGYLDPEYFRSSQFSEKSDVYSFGVVLVELLTGQKAIRSWTLEESEDDEEEERSLVEYFISSMNDSTFYDILDPIILQSSAKEDITTVANLAKKCLNPRGILRPTMKEVAMVLEGLRCQQSFHNQLNNMQMMSDITTVPTEGGNSFR